MSAQQMDLGHYSPELQMAVHKERELQEIQPESSWTLAENIETWSQTLLTILIMVPWISQSKLQNSV